MSWGLPPKYQDEHQFRNVDKRVIHQSVVNALINMHFEIDDNSIHFINGVKKLPLTFMSFFAFSKPKITAIILITNTGKLTVKSNYNYSSMHGIAFNDLGKQKIHINKLMSEITDIVKLNVEHEK
jgi:hypothetical protein